MTVLLGYIPPTSIFANLNLNTFKISGSHCLDYQIYEGQIHVYIYFVNIIGLINDAIWQFKVNR